MGNDREGEILTSAPAGAEEDDVIDLDLWGAIHVLHERGLSKSAIARRLGVDVKTVRKWQSRPWSAQHRRPAPRALDAHLDFVRGRAPEVGFNAMVLYREVCAKGYTGSYQAVARRVRPWREQTVPALEPAPRFETAPGKQAQVDWGSLGVWFGLDQFVRVHLFVMVLGFSRRIFVRAYRHERLDNLLDAHARAFAHFGGRSEQILYDNPRTIVVRKDDVSGEVVEWNTTFKDRMDFYGVDIKLCKYYRARTKGKVESGVKYVKRNALAGRRFRDLDDLNAWLEEWSEEVADMRVHGTTHEVPAHRFAREEAMALIPVSERPAPVRERVETRAVPSDAYVAVDTNRYPVPVEWIGQRVEVRIRVDQVVIDSGKHEPVVYARMEGKHKLAPWQGAPRCFARQLAGPASGPPRFDPQWVEPAGEVEVRSLAAYAALVEEVGP